MLLFLVRHADALDSDEDAVRPLSPKGREQVERMAKFLRASHAFRVDEIWHSPLIRARQTAKLLSEGLGLRVPLSEVAGLEPNHDAEATATKLRSVDVSLAVVGHEPHLSALASILVAGEIQPFFVMRKGAVLALERAGAGETSRWFVRWHVSPDLLGV
jgi:phosphohistidine phosphatase